MGLRGRHEKDISFGRSDGSTSDCMKRSILAYLHHLDLPMTNNQAERDLRPVKLHRKISSCFKSQAGATRFARVRSYMSTTRKNDIPALDALVRLFNGDPWMPPAPEAAA